MANSKQDSNGAEWIVSMLLVFCLFIPILAMLLFSRPVQVPACKVNKIGNVYSDSDIDGKLEFVTGGFAVRTADNRERFITHCGKSCTAPHEILKREKLGRPVHAEFCGKFLTMVAVDQVPIYIALPPTQAALNSSASGMHIVGIVLLAIFFVLLCAGLVRTRKK